MEMRVADVSDLEALRPMFDGQLAYMACLQPKQYRAVPQEDAYMLSCIQAESGAVLVAEEADQILGFVSVCMQESSPRMFRVQQRYGLLENIYVNSGHRRNGVGTALFEAAWSWCRDRGARTMQLMTLAENLGAQRFYAQMGMRFLKHIYVMEDDS